MKRPLPIELLNLVDSYLIDPLRLVRQEIHERWRIGSIWLDLVLRDNAQGIVLPVRGRAHRANILVLHGTDATFSFHLQQDFSEDNAYIRGLKRVSFLLSKNFFQIENDERTGSTEDAIQRRERVGDLSIV